MFLADPWICLSAAAIVLMTEDKSWHHMVCWVTILFIHLQWSHKRMQMIQLFFFLSLQKWFGSTKEMMVISPQGFFFRLISVTTKAKEGQVAILVYVRRCALVHGSVNKSCESERPDSSRDMLIPLTNSSILEKEKKLKNPTLASWENSMKIHRRFLSWGKLVDSVITQAQKRLKDSQKQKRQEKKITGGSRGVELGSGSQGQETNRVCQHCEVREINKRWQIRQSSCCVEGKD